MAKRILVIDDAEIERAKAHLGAAIRERVRRDGGRAIRSAYEIFDAVAIPSVEISKLYMLYDGEIDEPRFTSKLVDRLSRVACEAIFSIASIQAGVVGVWGQQLQEAASNHEG